MTDSVNAYLLFGKWEPVRVKFGDFGKNNKQTDHFFNDGYVETVLNGSHQCYIQGSFKIEGLDLGRMYQPHFLEMFQDAKRFSQDYLVKLAAKDHRFRSVKVDDIASFVRIIHISADIDLEKTGISIKEEKLRQTMIGEVYQRLEQRLKQKCAFKDGSLGVYHAAGIIPLDTKRISTDSGLHLLVHYNGGPIDAGKIYLKLAGDETANLDEHQKVLEELIRVLEEFPELDRFNGKPYNPNLRENGVLWKIQFDKIPMYKELAQTGITMPLIQGLATI